jgi:hypothetical protein
VSSAELLEDGEHRPAASPRDEALRWINDYLGRPDERIGRPGAVCPFVKPAQRAESLIIEEDPIGPDPSPGEMSRLVWDSVDTFLGMSWPQTNETLRVLVVMMPGLDDSAADLFERMHADVKGEIMRRGLMIGHFHPRITKGSGRNGDFPIEGAPVPMYSFRYMSFHDILFSHQRREWFGHYVRHFGRHYLDSDRNIEPLFVELFHSAVRKYRCRHAN